MILNSSQLSACDECGAVVENSMAEKHKEYHRTVYGMTTNLARLLSQITSAVTRLSHVVREMKGELP
jgi:hypothetical protein